MGQSTGKMLNLLNFGNSLTNRPTISNVTGAFNQNDARSIFLLKDGIDFIAFAQGQSGNLYRFHFGSSLGGIPSFTNLGNLNTLGATGPSARPSIAFWIGKEGSKWHAFTINRDPNQLPPFNVNQLVRIDFPDLCNSSPPFSQARNTEAFFELRGKTLLIWMFAIQVATVSQPIRIRFS